MPLSPDGSDRGPFWSVFEHSHIPMALVDRERRYAAVNDAAVELYQYSREEIIGTRAASGMPDKDPAAADASWQELLRMGELYGEQLVRVSPAGAMRVSYAAHATNIDGRWMALFVVLSAQVEPEGEELISGTRPVGADRAGSTRGSGASPRFGSAAKTLTPREREVVERVALGRSTPQIAADLNLSPATIRSHVRNAMVKADAHTRAQLVALVLGEGLSRG